MDDKEKLRLIEKKRAENNKMAKQILSIFAAMILLLASSLNLYIQCSLFYKIQNVITVILLMFAFTIFSMFSKVYYDAWEVKK